MDCLRSVNLVGVVGQRPGKTKGERLYRAMIDSLEIPRSAYVPNSKWLSAIEKIARVEQESMVGSYISGFSNADTIHIGPKKNLVFISRIVRIHKSRIPEIIQHFDAIESILDEAIENGDPRGRPYRLGLSLAQENMDA
jgi:hypothetical protein